MFLRKPSLSNLVLVVSAGTSYSGPCTKQIFDVRSVAAMITLIALGGLGSSASVDPKGVLLGWAGLGLSFLISVLGVASIRTSSQWPVLLLLLCALTGAVISETLVAVCMAGAFVSGLLATGGRVSIPLPSFGKQSSLPISPVAIDR